MNQVEKALRGIWAVGMVIWSVAAHASVSPDFSGLVQTNYPLNGTSNWVTDNKFQRQDYNAIGAMIVTNGMGLDPNTGSYKYLVDPGDTFQWVWRDTGTGEVIGEKSTTFLGGEYHCWSAGGCGAYATWRVYYQLQCLEEDTEVSVETYYNNLMYGSETFKPTRFHPRIYEVRVPGNISPKRTTSATGEAGEIVAVVEDDLDCALPIKDVKVKFTATVIGGTNGHGYLQTGDLGTGKFESLGFSSELNPDGEDKKDTVIEGSTDENGEYKANYRAYDHALMESIEVEATRPPAENDGELVAISAKANVKLSIPNLFQLTEANGAFAFHDLRGCPHKVGDLYTPVNYMTRTARTRLQIAATFFKEDTGAYLSINDASLPWGGVIANAGERGRDANCHGSHRKGVDVDINQTSRLTQDKESPLGPNLYSGRGEINGKPVVLLDYLVFIMSSVGGQQVREQDSIHFRFPG